MIVNNTVIHFIFRFASWFTLQKFTRLETTVFSVMCNCWTIKKRWRSTTLQQALFYCTVRSCVPRPSITTNLTDSYRGHVPSVLSDAGLQLGIVRYIIFIRRWMSDIFDYLSIRFLFNHYIVNFILMNKHWKNIL